MREPGFGRTDRGHRGPQCGNKLHLAHADRQSQHARQLGLERRRMATELGTRTPLGNGGEEGRPVHHVRRRLCEPALDLRGIQRTCHEDGVQVQCLVQSLLPAQTPRGRLGRRECRAGRRRRGVPSRVLHRGRTGLRDLREPVERLVCDRAKRDLVRDAAIERRFQRGGLLDDGLNTRGSDDVLYPREHQRDSDFHMHLRRLDRGLLFRHGDGNERDPRSHRDDRRDRDDRGAHREIQLFSDGPEGE